MKTPREILLARHGYAQPRLHAIRHNVVAGLESPPAGRRDGWLAIVWAELVWPCRTAWASLAALWLVVAALQWEAARQPDRTVQMPAVPSATNLSLAREERRRLGFEDEAVAGLPEATRTAPRSHLGYPGTRNC